MGYIIRLSEPDDLKSTFGYLVDATGFKFNEQNQSWIQAMPIGSWYHPIHGKIENTFERSQRFADNVNNNVRGQDISIDYEHKDQQKAAGWVKQARADAQQGLMLLVEWTKNAAQMIRDKEFRYFSPEYVDAWVEPKSKHKFTDVLLGGGLTNRPFLKGILPVNLSEIVDSVTESNADVTSGGNMDRAALEKLAKLHGIEFDESTTDEDLSTKVGEAVIAAEESDDSGESADTTEDEEPVLITASELKKLAEDNPGLKKLAEGYETMAHRLEVVETANRLAETQVKLSELDTGKIVLTPVAKKQLSELMINPTADGALEFAKTVLNNGTVELGERTSSRNLSGDGNSFQELVKKLTEGDKMDYVDAVEQVSREHPELWEAHRQAVFSGEDQ